jgi:predicted NBD/HSP70 family sugar kinase
MRAASRSVHVSRGLTLANRIDDLSDAAEAGDHQAQQLISAIARALDPAGDA